MCSKYNYVDASVLETALNMLCLFICFYYFMLFLARLYEGTGRAIAVTPALASASALASALLKMLKAISLGHVDGLS